MDTVLRVHIGGMTCVNCQNIMEKALRRTKGVVSATVSYAHATADIVYHPEEISPEDISAVIESLGYEALADERAGRPGIMNMVSLLVIIVALYVMLQSLGILNRLAPSQLADSRMGYGMLFVIGLLTSVHCIAMCGGINLSQCLPQTARSGAESGLFLPALAYNMGRVCSYTAAGVVLGLVGFCMDSDPGSWASIHLQGMVKILAGLGMVIMGITMLGIFPWLRRFTPRMPKFFAPNEGTRKAKAARPFVVGLLNGCMPCGPLQSMWVVALAAGNPFAGGLSMFLFSLGTVPLMLGLGSLVSALGRKFTHAAMTVGAVLVVVLGLSMLSQGGSLSGWLPPDLLLVLVMALCAAGVMLSLPLESTMLRYGVRGASLLLVVGAYALWSFQGLPRGDSKTENTAELVNGVQVVTSTLSSGRYPNITVREGIPVTWIIDAPEGSINGCNNRILIQDYGIEHSFHPGKNVIEFTPARKGTVRYSCWMGMIHGAIRVTDGDRG
ncbi:MAG: sulfite exporter TauE/SafE family protein [Desulfovibrionaceae bacterium]|nr:sulfite exporter TauE/SafE family protein [Desulfovibrionaceae bacterium]